MVRQSRPSSTADNRSPSRDIQLPRSFPLKTFRRFGIRARKFLPVPHSREWYVDRHDRTPHFDSSWQAVRYRYRSCVETAREFRFLVANAGERWIDAMELNEELTYSVEKCIYAFFGNALSVFDSFAFCLYFLGNGVRPLGFKLVGTPERITIKETAKAYNSEFPSANISFLLGNLLTNSDFKRLAAIRNVLMHRLAGRKTVQASSVVSKGKILQYRKDVLWHIPGCAETVRFSKDTLHRELRLITKELRSLINAADQFALTP